MKELQIDEPIDPEAENRAAFIQEMGETLASVRRYLNNNDTIWARKLAGELRDSSMAMDLRQEPAEMLAMLSLVLVDHLRGKTRLTHAQLLAMNPLLDAIESLIGQLEA